MKVEFLKDYGTLKKGDKKELCNSVAAELISKKIAKKTKDQNKVKKIRGKEIVFLKDFGAQKKGSIKTLCNSVAAELISKGIAKENIEEPVKKETKKKK